MQRTHAVLELKELLDLVSQRAIDKERAVVPFAWSDSDRVAETRSEFSRRRQIDRSLCGGMFPQPTQVRIVSRDRGEFTFDGLIADLLARLQGRT